MHYITLKNRAGRFAAFFAETLDEAKQEALRIGHARKLENLRFSKDLPACSKCFPNKGWACHEVRPRDTFLAGTVPQLSNHLHDEKSCGALGYRKYYNS